MQPDFEQPAVEEYMKIRPSVCSALMFIVLVAAVLQGAAARTQAAVSPRNYPTLEPDEVTELFIAKGRLSSPALSFDGLTVYVGSLDRNLYAIDTLSGSNLWSVRLPAPISSSPVINDDGLIYVGCTDGKLYGISDQGDSGQIDFEARLGGEVNNSPAVDDEGNVYAGTTANHLFAFRPDTSRLWSYTASNDVTTPVISPEGTVYVVSGNQLLGVDTADGSEASRFTPRSAIKSIPAMTEDGTLYFGANDERVYALGSGGTTNDVLWRFNTGQNVLSSPAIGADGRIYIGSDASRIFCLNSNGVRQWSVATRGPVRSELSIGVDGTVYAGSDDKRLYAVSSEGEVIWTAKLGAPVRSSAALDAFGGVFVTAGRKLFFIQTEAAADDTDEPAWPMFRKDRLHSARATECRPFLIQEPTALDTNGEPQTTLTATNGDVVSISVVVRAGAPVSYQWQLNGEDIDPTENRTATNATYVIGSASGLDAGVYTVTAFNDCGEVESDTFTLNIDSPPIITQQPTNVFTLAGNTVRLRVVAVGTLPLTYQWKKDDVAIPGATNATLTITNAQPSDSSSNYYVMIMNRIGDVPYATNSTTVVVRVFPVTLDFADHPLGAGHRHSLAVLSNRTLWAWGLDNFGQLGDNQSGGSGTNFVLRNIPALIGTNGAANTNAVWVNVSGGSRGYDASTNQPGGFSLGIQTNGSLWAWGLNDHGQLGIASTNNVRVPTRVGTDTNWVQVEAGATHAIGLKRDGSLWAWGGNAGGQLGIGSTNRISTTPVRIGTDSAWVEVRAGGFFSMARRADGTIWTWGTNQHGQLGIGSNANSGANALRRAPVMVGADTDWTGISAGGFHAMGIRSNGTIWAWGRNNFGQLGLGTGVGDGRDNFNTNRPAQISSVSNWMAIEAGTFHSFAIDAGRNLFGWGANFYGQIGNGEIGSASEPHEFNKTTPVAVAAGMTWRSVDASDHSLGMTTDGKVWAWGLNNYGQVGDGTGGDGTANNNRSAPVMLSFIANTNAVGTNPPSITAQPTSLTVLQGTPAVFTVGASGAETYQWYFNSAAISSSSNPTATNFSLQISNAQVANVGEYVVVVANSFGAVTSALASLNVTNSSGEPLLTNAPAFSQQPASMIANEGTNVTFSVMATGAPPISYQWYFFSNAIPAATAPIFVLTNVQGSNAGYYRAVASNAFGTVTSVLASLAITNTNGMIFLPGNTNGIPFSNSPPIITQQPTNRSGIPSGTNVSFVVVADGGMPLFYQWRFRTNSIDPAANPTATNATLTISNTATTNSGFYDVVISNSFGSVTSVMAGLIVTPGLPTMDESKQIRDGKDVWIKSIVADVQGVVIEVTSAGEFSKLILDFKDRLDDAEWKVLSTHDPKELKLLDPAPPTNGSRYYRVRVE